MSAQIAWGWAAACAAACIGAAWQLVTRYGVSTALEPLDLAALRYGVPALALMPLWWRAGLRPAGVPWSVLALMVGGGGLPFGLLVMAGATQAPAAHLAVFMAGTMPVFTGLAAWWFMREPMQPVRACGFTLIVGGVAWLGWRVSSASAAYWIGDACFLAAALAWAGHTLAFRRSGLSVWQAAAIVNAWSSGALLCMLPWSGVGRLAAAPWPDLAAQVLGQGVLAGLLGGACYLAAVRRLGAARASLSSALVPVLTTVGAAQWLGEAASPPVWAAVALIAAGIVLASGVLRLRARGATPAAPPRIPP